MGHGLYKKYFQQNSAKFELCKFKFKIYLFFKLIIKYYLLLNIFTMHTFLDER